MAEAFPRSPAGREAVANFAAYAAFAATGVSLVLPGALLSLLLVRWSLDDKQGGALFFLFFLGSMSGASLSRGVLSRAIAFGCLCASAGAYALAVSSHSLTFLAMPLFGLGLGMTMTSISLLQSRRRADARAVEMARLNLTWACGASAGPAILLRCAIHWSVQAVLCAVAASFLALALLALVVLAGLGDAGPAVKSPVPGRGFATLPLLLLAIVPLATGVESSVGGWLEAYARRSGLLLDATISTVTCFWAGILLSRLVQSHRKLASPTRRTALSLGPWLMSAALVLILVHHHGWYMLAGALLLGIGVGPIYPLTLSMMLAYGEAGNAVFVIAGVGASSLPLLTGLVSGWTGSLAAGLTVPLAGSLTMAVFSTLARRRQLLNVS